MDLIFVHGRAAAGKLTTARALGSVLGYPVFHNHLVVDTLTTVFPFGSEPFVRLRDQMWLSVFADAARADTSLIFTFAPESTVPAGFPDRARTAVEDEGGKIHFVHLVVSDTEQEQRVVAEGRKEFHKLTDVDILRTIRAFDDTVEQPPADLEIDTGKSDPETSAATIAAHFSLTPRPPIVRFPS
ncbi:hypothetical protein [Pseudonocardia spinosispora]|uniref:hypothetical protein n=1 Tax=Pseudonocardia spinosispora TaxID=103441 RepID=UPI00068581C1|nr:hypothetical protein [Pseudonocardia spinosispora]